MKSTPPSHGPKGLQFPAGMRSPYRWVGEKSLPSSCLMCCGAASLWQASGHLALPWESNGTSQPSLGQHGHAVRQGQAGKSPREVQGDQGGRGPVPRRQGEAGPHRSPAPRPHTWSSVPSDCTSHKSKDKSFYCGHFWGSGPAQSYWLKPALHEHHEASSAIT